MTTLGVLVGNRGFFPAELCEQGRKIILSVLKEEGIEAVALGPKDTKYGSVEPLSDAKKCADLFKANREKIDGILVTLPNFGDERGHRGRHRDGGAGCPGAGPRVPRRAGTDGNRAPAGQLLRQDVRVQQPHPVRASATPSPRSTPWTRSRRRSARDLRRLRGGLPGGQGHAEGPLRPDRRAARGVRHGALQREAPGARGDLRGEHRPVRGVRPGVEPERQGLLRRVQAGRDHGAT